jgi:hypothetical protein
VEKTITVNNARSVQSSEQRHPQAMSNTTLSVLLDQCGHNAQPDVGMDIWEAALRDGLRPSVNNLNAALEMLARCKQFQRAEELLARAEVLGVQPDRLTHSIIPSLKAAPASTPTKPKAEVPRRTGPRPVARK